MARGLTAVTSSFPGSVPPPPQLLSSAHSRSSRWVPSLWSPSTRSTLLPAGGNSWCSLSLSFICLLLITKAVAACLKEVKQHRPRTVWKVQVACYGICYMPCPHAHSITPVPVSIPFLQMGKLSHRQIKSFVRDHRLGSG